MRIQKTGRSLVTLVFAAAVSALIAAPLGCDPPKPPDAPEAPKQEPKGGACCVKRNSALSDQVCNPAGARCCTGKFVESEACEAQGGVWFFSMAGCAGAGC